MPQSDVTSSPKFKQRLYDFMANDAVVTAIVQLLSREKRYDEIIEQLNSSKDKRASREFALSVGLPNYTYLVTASGLIVSAAKCEYRLELLRVVARYYNTNNFGQIDAQDVKFILNILVEENVLKVAQSRQEED